MNPAEPDKKQQLLDRLNEIMLSLERSGHALALMGLGSTGQAADRLDAYSDLDFFVIVEEGYENLFRDNLDWLSAICPLAFYFKNTVHGYKALFEDGIFIEFAVFGPAEIEEIPYADARVIWSASPVFTATLSANNRRPRERRQEVEWLVGEALTNLYVGLSRYRRGEKLSAARFIQGHALDRLIDLSEYIEPEPQHGRDPFSKTRRYEQRYPNLAPELPNLIQGYDRCVESALANLDFLEQRFEVNEAMRAEILNLAQGDED
jgi:hypothetical protein